MTWAERHKSYSYMEKSLWTGLVFCGAGDTGMTTIHTQREIASAFMADVRLAEGQWEPLL